jgi:hypothetical protein
MANPNAKANLPPQYQNGGPGRRKGTPNKISNDVRKYFLEAAETLESEGKGFLEFARKYPVDAWKIIAKTLPKDLNVGGRLDFVIRDMVKEALTRGADTDSE